MSSTALEFYSEKFVEISEVVRTVDVVHNNKRYRVEILKGYSNPNLPFSVKCWIEEEVEIHPVWNEKGNPSDANSMKKITVLRQTDLPWLSPRNDSEGALQQALGFLAEKVKAK